MLVALGLFTIVVTVKHVWALLNTGQTLRDVEAWHNKQTTDQLWKEWKTYEIDRQEVDSVKNP